MEREVKRITEQYGKLSVQGQPAELSETLHHNKIGRQVVHAFDTSTREAEAVGSPQVRGQPCLICSLILGRLPFLFPTLHKLKENEPGTAVLSGAPAWPVNRMKVAEEPHTYTLEIPS